MSLRTHASRARRWTIRKRSPRYGEAVFLLAFGVETAGRLPPFKGETPKRLKKSRFRAGSDYIRHPNLRYEVGLPKTKTNNDQTGR